MSFTSLGFLIFLPCILLLHWLLPHRFRYLALLAGSYFFYGYLNPWLLPLLLSTTLVSYLCSLGMEKYQKRRKLLLFLGIFFVLGLLFTFKYLDFTFSLFVLAGLNLSFYPLNLVLPVGISFYTFQTLAYMIDVFKGKTTAERHIGYYALFVSFFPQLVAGPIEKSQRLLPQLKAKRTLDLDGFGIGLRYVAIGFIKKVVIADFFAVYVNSVYSGIASFSGFEILLATFLFGLVIYGDFSGYSDIALGVAKWLGVDLTKNFDRPYLSSSLKEFWNRWHITLNDFFTEYVYIPLGGSRKGRFRKYLNIMIVFLLSGLWHGASLHFLLWGVAHGILLVLEDLLSPLWEKIKMPKTFKMCLSIFFTFIVVNLLWVFFRAQTIGDSFLAFQRIFTAFASIFDLSFFSVLRIVYAILVVVALILLPYLPRLEKGNQRSFSYLGLYAALFIIVGLCYFNNLSSGGESSFIYFAF